MRDVSAYVKGKSLQQLAEEIARYLDITNIPGYMSAPGPIDWTSTSENLSTTGSGTFGSIVVDDITINAAAITSATGSVGFGDDNLVTTGYFQTTCAAAATNAILISVAGDTNKRFDVNADGEINWGSGGAALDTNLYRNAANELKTDDWFLAWVVNAENSFEIGGTTVINNLLAIGNITELTVDNININGETITSATGAISFGNENLTTTGLITANNLDVDTLNLNGNVISDSTGTIGFSNENLTTTGTITAGTLTIQNGAITDTTGAISFLNESLSTTGNIRASNFVTAGNVDGVDVSAFKTAYDNHSARHENTGADEISVLNLSGLLADAQTPLAHNQSAATITTGTLVHERGGLEANVSAYAGLIKITGGATSNLASTAGGEARITNASNHNTVKVFTDNVLNVHTVTIQNSLVTAWTVT